MKTEQNAIDVSDMDDRPTSRICGECKGEGMVYEESGTTYACRQCKWCNGKGSIPISGIITKAVCVLGIIATVQGCSGHDPVPIGDPPVNPMQPDAGYPVEASSDAQDDTSMLPDAFKPVPMQCPYAGALCEFVVGNLVCDLCTPHKHAYTCDSDGVWQDETLPAPTPCTSWCIPETCP